MAPGLGGLNTVVTVSEKVNQINKSNKKEVSELEKQYGRLQTRQEKILFLAKKYDDFGSRKFIRSKTEDKEFGSFRVSQGMCSLCPYMLPYFSKKAACAS